MQQQHPLHQVISIDIEKFAWCQQDYTNTENPLIPGDAKELDSGRKLEQTQQFILDRPIWRHKARIRIDFTLFITMFDEQSSIHHDDPCAYLVQ